MSCEDNLFFCIKSVSVRNIYIVKNYSDVSQYLYYVKGNQRRSLCSDSNAIFYCR